MHSRSTSQRAHTRGRSAAGGSLRRPPRRRAPQRFGSTRRSSRRTIPAGSTSRSMAAWPEAERTSATRARRETWSSRRSRRAACTPSESVHVGNTNADDYATTIVCRADRGAGAELGASNIASLAIRVAPGQEVVCTIRNVRTSPTPPTPTRRARSRRFHQSLRRFRRSPLPPEPPPADSGRPRGHESREPALDHDRVDLHGDDPRDEQRRGARDQRDGHGARAAGDGDRLGDAVAGHVHRPDALVRARDARARCFGHDRGRDPRPGRRSSGERGRGRRRRGRSRSDGQRRVRAGARRRTDPVRSASAQPPNGDPRPPRHARGPRPNGPRDAGVGAPHAAARTRRRARGDDERRRCRDLQVHAASPRCHRGAGAGKQPVRVGLRRARAPRPPASRASRRCR